MPDYLSDEQVAMYAALTETERRFNDYGGETVYALAREVQRRRAAERDEADFQRGWERASEPDFGVER